MCGIPKIHSLVANNKETAYNNGYEICNRGIVIQKFMSFKNLPVTREHFNIVFVGTCYVMNEMS